uniref:Uncharacterized protein n=3 Tax=Oryza sativa subsp. japonica TaxID=39947 RepID=A0A5S6R7C1_ORYSJ|nr:Hypothetical protein [Oryza sativa Japonica Group]ABB46798.2 hypothetical protein LOC_Os10g07110 [Oryza sativa Japonica Group]
MERPLFELFAPRGEFYEPPPSSEPILTPGYEICSEFISMCVEPHPEAFVSGREEPSFAKTEPKPSTSSSLTTESSMKPSPDSREIQAPGCAPKFRDGPHTDYVKTLIGILPDNTPIEEVMAVLLHESPESTLEHDDLHFIRKDSGETLELHSKEPPSQPPIEREPCPSGHQNVVLDICQETTLFLHDASLEKENLQAMDKLETSTLEDENSTNEHESFSFKVSSVVMLT